MSAHGISPWRTAFELMVNRKTSDPTEAVTIKTVTTGTLAGTHGVEVIAYAREGETLQECADRANVVYTNSYRTHNLNGGAPVGYERLPDGWPSPRVRDGR